MGEEACSGEWTTSGENEEGCVAWVSHRCPAGGVPGHGCEGAQWATYVWDANGLAVRALVGLRMAEVKSEVVSAPADVGSRCVDQRVKAAGRWGRELADPQESKESQRESGCKHVPVAAAEVAGLPEGHEQVGKHCGNDWPA